MKGELMVRGRYETFVRSDGTLDGLQGAHVPDTCDEPRYPARCMAYPKFRPPFSNDIDEGDIVAGPLQERTGCSANCSRAPDQNPIRHQNACKHAVSASVA
jgi:hypothetical protein